MKNQSKFILSLLSGVALLSLSAPTLSYAACGTANANDQTIECDDGGNFTTAIGDGNFNGVEIEVLNNTTVTPANGTAVLMEGNGTSLLVTQGSSLVSSDDFAVTAGTNAGTDNPSDTINFGTITGASGAVTISSGASDFTLVNAVTGDTELDAVFAVEGEPTPTQLFRALVDGVDDGAVDATMTGGVTLESVTDLEIFNFGDFNGGFSNDGNIENADVIVYGNAGSSDGAIDFTTNNAGAVFEVYNTGEIINGGSSAISAEESLFFNLGTDTDLDDSQGVASFVDLLLNNPSESDFATDVRRLVTNGIGATGTGATASFDDLALGGATSESALVVNLGTINGLVDAEVNANGLVEIYNAAGATISNGAGIGVYIAGGSAANAATGDFARIINLGTITGTGDDAIESDAEAAVIINGSNATALTSAFFGDGTDVDDTVVNNLLRQGNAGADTFGTINGNVDINDTDGAIFLNLGSVNGDVDFDAGDDEFLNVGTVTGSVDLGGGDDTVQIGTGTTIGGTVDGGAQDTSDEITFFGTATYDPAVYIGFEEINFDYDANSNQNRITVAGSLAGDLTVASNVEVTPSAGTALASGANVNVTLESGSTLVGINQITGNQGALNVNQTGTFGATVTGFDNLVTAPTGSTILNLDQDVTINTAATLSSGNTAINANFNGGTGGVNVNSGATLSGTGTITGDVVVQGIHAPGNSIGTQTFNNNYTLDAGATLQIEINATQSDVLAVTGDVTFGNASEIDVIAEPTANYAIGDTTYDIITYTGNLTDNGLSGTVDVDLPFLTAAIDQTNPNVVQLVITRTGTNLNGSGAFAGTNQGAAIDSAVASASDQGFLTLVQNIGSLSGDQLNKAVNSVTGKVNGAISSARQSSSMSFVNIVNSTNAGARNSGLGASVGSNNQFSFVNGSGSGMSAGNQVGNGYYWLKPYGTFGDVDLDNNTSDHDFSGGGLAAGVVVDESADYNYGLSFGYGMTTLDGFVTGDEVEIDSYFIAGSAGFGLGGGLDLQTSLTYGFDQTDQTRFAVVGASTSRIKADYDTHQVIASAELGQSYALTKTLNMRPSIGAAYIYEMRDSYTETGTGGIAYDDFKTHRGLATASLGFDKSFQMSRNLPGILSASVGVEQLIGNLDEAQSAVFNAGGGSFDITGEDIDKTSFVGGLGIELPFNNGSDLSLNYDTKLNSDVNAHAVSATIKWNF